MILLNETKLVEIVDFSRIRSIFHGALISPSIFISKKEISDHYFTRIKMLSSDSDVENLNSLDYFTKRKDELVNSFQIITSTIDDEILNFIEQTTETLGSLKKKGYVDIRTGVMGFDYWSLENFVIDYKNENKPISGWIIATNGN